MNLQSLIQTKIETNGPVRVGLIGAGEIITFADVDLDETSLAVKIRREAEALI